jgi:hypothetical protein
VWPGRPELSAIREVNLALYRQTIFPAHLVVRPILAKLTLKFRMALDTSERAIWTMPLFTVRFGS